MIGASDNRTYTKIQFYIDCLKRLVYVALSGDMESGLIQEPFKSEKVESEVVVLESISLDIVQVAVLLIFFRAFHKSARYSIFFLRAVS